MAEELTTSVIVCTKDRVPEVVRFLESLQGQTSQPDDIIIIDASNKKLTSYSSFNKIFSRNFFPTSKLLYQHSSPGLTLQRNKGVALASSEILTGLYSFLIFRMRFPSRS